MTPVFGIGSVIYTGIEIGVHLEPGLGCVEVTTVLRYCTVLYCTVLYCTVLYCTVWRSPLSSGTTMNYLALNAVSERKSPGSTKM